MESVEKFLVANEIEYIMHEHEAVFTVEEATKYCSHIPGLHCKNLFLKGNKGRRYFLIVLPANKRVDLKNIATQLGEKRIGFASPERLLEKLGLTPGSVSPFGLLNDIENKVEVFVDVEVYYANILSFHPNRNTASVELKGVMFRKYLEALENIIAVVDFNMIP